MAGADEGERTVTCGRDHGRGGTARLMATPVMVTGKVTGRTAGRHRSEESVAIPAPVVWSMDPGGCVHVTPAN